MYDFKTADPKPIAMFELASSQKDNHANNASFGIETKKGATYPLLYISVGKPGNAIDLTCFVESITKKGKKFSSELVQKIILDINGWSEAGYVPIFGAPSWMVDQKRGELWEEKYGISTEIYRDELGRFRGSPCHIGSIDATHTTRCAQGSICICCLFENMCDDGTNQNHMHARIAAMTDNGDGTTTIDYKGCLSMFDYNYYGGKEKADHQCAGYCSDFTKGDRVYIYTSAGQLVCDSPALTDGISLGMQIAPEYGTEYEVKRVTVATADVNFKAIEGYDLSRNTPDDKPGDKVLIDNMSMASNGFTFDNVLVRNVRSRALLIKASDAKIVSCTFRDIGMSCVAILYEIFWGESGVSENMLVTRNLFDHTGFFYNVDNLSPVSIEGLGSRVDEDYLLYKNSLEHVRGACPLQDLSRACNLLSGTMAPLHPRHSIPRRTRNAPHAPSS